MISKIIQNNILLSIIVYSNYNKSGIHFFTDDNLEQQLGFMKHAKGKEIQPHVHKKTFRKITSTQEVLFIRKCRLSGDFYNDKKEYIESKILESGDVIILIQGGHGFEVLEDLEMFEVKQGPYIQEDDKTRFTSISSNEIKLN